MARKPAWMLDRHRKPDREQNRTDQERIGTLKTVLALPLPYRIATVRVLMGLWCVVSRGSVTTTQMDGSATAAWT